VDIVGCGLVVMMRYRGLQRADFVSRNSVTEGKCDWKEIPCQDRASGFMTTVLTCTTLVGLLDQKDKVVRSR
jgi:hypothetical protein